MSAYDPAHQNRENPGSRSAAALGGEDEALEQYGVWVKAGPVDVEGADTEASPFEISDLDVPEEAEEISLTEEEEQLLGSLEGDELPGLNPRDEALDLDDLPRLGGGEEDAFTIGESDAVTDLEVPSDIHETVDVVSESGRTNETHTEEEEVPMDISEGSASILQKIEEDLLSIKAELTALKNEIYSLRGAVPTEAAGEKREETESGFFAEDEDETIALTGDELDNILNTADITEQTGQSTVVPDDSDLVVEEEPRAQAESLVDRPDIIDLNEDVAAGTGSEEPEIGDLDLEGNEVDLASITAGPADEFSFEQEPVTVEPESDLLDLPEEEEIVLEELEEPTESNEAEAGPEEIEIDFGESESVEKAKPAPKAQPAKAETSFDLDEELDLSPSEKEDIGSSAETLGDEELPDISGADFELPEAEAPESLDFIAEEVAPASPSGSNGSRKEPGEELSEDLKAEIRAVLRYMDQLLESLPEEKIEEFARSQYFDTYKRLFEELGLTTS